MRQRQKKKTFIVDARNEKLGENPPQSVQQSLEYKFYANQKKTAASNKANKYISWMNDERATISIQRNVIINKHFFFLFLA